MPGNAILRIQSASLPLVIFAVGTGKFILGRSHKCDLVIHDISVSRRHAEIVVGAGGASIRDLDSANGTFVNEKRVRASSLRHGQRLRFGNVDFQVMPVSARENTARSEESTDTGESRRPSGPGRAARPFFDSEGRVLFFKGLVVKEFHRPADNQIVILTSFQELGWPTRIDDPLPHTKGINPRTRLHDAINRLNRNQQNPLLKFHGDGLGQGLSWEALD